MYNFANPKSKLILITHNHELPSRCRSDKKEILILRDTLTALGKRYWLREYFRATLA